MRRRVFFRVDGGEDIGFGHLMRCVALSRILVNFFDIHFICKEVPSKISLEIKKDFQLIKIQEEAHFFNLLKLNHEIVVVDGYHFKEDFYLNLKKKDAIIVSIQDINCFSENVDLVINHLPEVQEYYENVDLLHGPEHAIIRNEFFKKIPLWNSEGDFFISLGGTANFNTLNHIVKIINSSFPDKKIQILTTNTNRVKLIGDNINVHTDKNANDVIDLIDQCSVCLITSGMIVYEVLSRNKRSIVGALNEGQDMVGRNMGSMGLTEYVGMWRNFDQKKFLRALEWRNINPLKINSVFDGKSGERILNKFLEL